tara:strand:- start:353 stop:625 length:273 start_codon:yes stop_codon:yes gene_type:complete
MYIYNIERQHKANSQNVIGVNIMTELRKHYVKDVIIQKKKYSSFNFVSITIVSQKGKDEPEIIELSLHCRDVNGKKKFPKFSIGKIETVE